MQRRRILAGIALSLPLAGCSTSEPSEPIESPTATPTSGGQDTSGEQDTSESTPTDTDNPTETSSPTESPTESGQADVSIGAGTFGVADFGYSEYPYYEVELTNEGSAPSGIVEIVVDWFDDSDEYVSDTREQLVSLNPGETWIARSYNVLERDTVSSAEASGGYESAPPEWPDGLDVESSQLLAGDENAKVRATVANNTGQTVGYVAFYGKLYDGDGNVLGQVWTNESDLADGSSWRAESSWDDDARMSLVEDHEVLLEGNIY